MTQTAAAATAFNKDRNRSETIEDLPTTDRLLFSLSGAGWLACDCAPRTARMVFLAAAMYVCDNDHEG
jgi:hypothetical protein